MPYDKEYYKKWREANKEKIKEHNKKYKEKNKEKTKEYTDKNKEKKKEYDKVYYKTEAGKKLHRIQNWKSRGVISDDYNSLYEYYLNCKNCEECNVELVECKKSNSRCLDHNHKTGLFRNVLCNSCNVKRG